MNLKVGTTALVPQGEIPVLQLLGFLSLVTSKFSLCEKIYGGQ
jgi:hypothetical protein